MTKLLAPLLTLLALGCSLDTSAPHTLLVGLSCDWEQWGDIVLPPQPGCWSTPDPYIALTPTWVDSPCTVDEFKRDVWGSGESVRVWSRLLERITRDNSELETELLKQDCQ